MTLKAKFPFILLLQMLSSCVCVRTISPLDYGLNNAKTDIERYEILLNTHVEAIKQNCGVSYKGIKSINIEIPEHARIIPLPKYTDFAGVSFNVYNNSKDDFFLFFLENEPNGISLDKECFNELKFDIIPELNDKIALLVVEDKTPWVKIRTGYDYGFNRRDIIVIEKGKPDNAPIQPYKNELSSPKFKYYKVGKDQKVIKNIIFNRSDLSNSKTFLIKVVGQNNVLLDNITINTLDSKDMYGDNAICIQNCANVTLRNITINGTYSQKNKYGYGIYLNNVWNTRFLRIKADANWGVFGSYNVNHARVKDCDINRFDIHCYGRDVYFSNTTFNKLYNQFSSIYGELMFENCIFNEFTPVLIESSFNAYTPFEITWKNCTFFLNQRHNYLINLLSVPESNKERPELIRKSLPNILMDKCDVILADDVCDWFLFWTGEVDYKDTFDNISHITITDLKVRSVEDKNFILFSENVKTTNQLEIKIKSRKF